MAAKAILAFLYSMHLKTCLELLRVDQEAGDVDEVEPNCQEERLLALRLEYQSNTGLIVVPEID